MTDVTTLKHPFGILQRVLGTTQILFGNDDVRFLILEILLENLQILFDVDLSHFDLRLSTDLGGLRFPHRDFLCIDIVCDRRIIQLHQLVSFFDNRPVFDDFENGGAPLHATFNRNVVTALHVAIFGHGDGQRPLNSVEDLIGLTCGGTTTCGTTSRRLTTTRSSDQQAPNGTPKSDGAESVHEADLTVLTDTTWLFNFAHRRHLFSLAVYLQETRLIYVHNRGQKSPTEECVILTICESQANWKNKIIGRKNPVPAQINSVTK